MAIALHSMGGQALANASRETVMYQSSQFQKATPLAVELIADTILRPNFLDVEIKTQRESAGYEIREMAKKPEVILPEIFHEIAYGATGLGNPILCKEDRLDAITPELIRGCMQSWYRPERMVLAGAGIPHEQLLKMAYEHFSHLMPTSPSAAKHNSFQPSQTTLRNQIRSASHLTPTLPTGSSAPLNANSTYTGGSRFILDREAEFNHLYVGFEGVDVQDEDIYPLATMHVLLGGGGSFSAGAYLPSLSLLTLLNLTLSQVALARGCSLDCTPTFSTHSLKSTIAPHSITSIMRAHSSGSSPPSSQPRPAEQMATHQAKFFHI